MLYRSWLWPGSVHKSSYITRCVTQPYNRKKKTNPKQYCGGAVCRFTEWIDVKVHYSKLHHIWL